MTRWTHESIDAELASKVIGRQSHLDAVGRIIDDLLAERDAAEEKAAALAKLHPDPEVTYRLPEWLGGLPVDVVSNLTPEQWGSHVQILIDGAPDSSTPEVPAHWLVPVKAPSIDDPNRWPLVIERGDVRLTLRNPAAGAIPAGVATIEVIRPGGRISIVLDEDELWELAKSAYSFVKGRRRFDELNGGAR